MDALKAFTSSISTKPKPGASKGEVWRSNSGGLDDDAGGEEGGSDWREGSLKFRGKHFEDQMRTGVAG